jgi:polyferredoxin
MTTARRIVQAGMLALVLGSVFLVPANAEAWCPLGGIEALYTYAREGNLICSLGVSNFYAILAVLVSVILVRRAFCGYLCPIGAVSEWLGSAARRLGLRRFRVPGVADRILSAAKYPILILILAATWQAGELAFRGSCPAYALLGRHGADITYWAYVVAGAIAVVSLVVTMPFCRWFCPLAAVLNPLSRFGLTRIRRDPSACTTCGRCTAACPMAIPVDRVLQVTHARCLACMNCTEACPSKKGNPLTWRPPLRAWPRGAVIGILLACMGAAMAAACLAPFPSFIKSRGEAPTRVATVDLKIRDLTCRGRANLLVGFLDRDDLYQIRGASSRTPGYYRLEAWPNPGVAAVRISYDPSSADAESIQRAITEPYFDLTTNRWWQSPFVIEGYTPPGLDNDIR